MDDNVEVIEYLEDLNWKLGKILSELKTLNSTNSAILERLVNMQEGRMNSISDICDNIVRMRGVRDFDDEDCSLLDVKEAIENLKQK